MLVGIPPFYTSNRQELFERIKFAAPKYPPHLSKRAKDLLELLLKKDPAKRLGFNGDAQVIKNHPWFEGVNWKALFLKQYEAPFVPKINNEVDLSNFDPEFTEIAINSMSQNAGSDMLNHQNYQGFSWNRDAELDGNGMDIER